MFGYIKSDYANLYVKDTVLYKAMYCSLCKGIGQVFGQKARFTLSYDLAFLSAFLHNVLGKDVEVEKKRCIIHPIVKRPIANVDELTKQIAILNVILAYYKLEDAVTDNEGGGIKKAVFKRAYKKAKKLQPKMDEIVKKRYLELRELEKKNIDSIDMSAEPFGNMIRDLVEEICKDEFSKDLGEISYNLGKWIYLIDAIDDYDKDKRKKSFNVFINVFKAKDKQTFLAQNTQELINILSPSIMAISRSANNLKYKFNHDLCDNILNRGLILETKRILENKKCEKSMKY